MNVMTGCFFIEYLAYTTKVERQRKSMPEKEPKHSHAFKNFSKERQLVKKILSNE